MEMHPDDLAVLRDHSPYTPKEPPDSIPYVFGVPVRVNSSVELHKPRLVPGDVS